MAKVSDDIGQDVSTGKLLRAKQFVQLGGKKLRSIVETLRKTDDQRTEKDLTQVTTIIHNFELCRKYHLQYPDMVDLAKRATHHFFKRGEAIFKTA